MNAVLPVGLKRYPFKGIANFRDLGGCPIGENAMTRYQIFFRSTHLNQATEEDIALLKLLNIKTVIDLRHEFEEKAQPDVIKSDPFFEWIHLSLLGDITFEFLADKLDTVTRNNTSLYTLYSLLIEKNPELIRQLISLLANACQKGAVLFHCSAGKDRTGLTALLLQGLAGVSRQDLVAEYEISHSHLYQFCPQDISGSHYDNMERLLNDIEQNYGSISGYLDHIGVKAHEKETLIHKLYQSF
ncbi:MAG: tyrosine-protein phosphatase [Clostridia bacterium]|nr:tyrosine-protein phosphatase [Clostridia bacterium]